MSDGTECRRILDALAPFGRIYAIKLFRVVLDDPPATPLLPCLDHEVKLHGGIPPHLAAYLQDGDGGDLHEIAFYPARRRIEIDTVSTWGEHSPESHARVRDMLAATFPDYGVHVTRPSWYRGDRRVAEASASHVRLSDVLRSPDLDAVQARVDRLQIVSTLMEKESRVASWGIRTVTGPMLAAAGVVTVFSASGVIRTLLVTLLGVVFVYIGLKAVQLTGMANRVWKRSAEYTLILKERRRLARLADG